MHTNNYKNIIILGNSKKFINLIKNNFIYRSLNILSWRNHKILENQIKKADLIIVCGFDYQSCEYNYKKFYKVNISKPFDLIKKFYKKETTIIYINTILKNKYTLSRYYFAKHKLNEMLIKNFKNLISMEIPTIITDGKVDVFGSKIAKIIFQILIFLKIVDCINYKNLKKKIINCLKYYKHKDSLKINGIFLKVPRNIYLDRILRFL